VPGITGWAQVNGRDNLTIYEKVMFEVDYNKNKSFWFDLKILWLTVLKVFSIKQISH
jgi:O-antigen biosynthesis protein WbqP